MENPIDVSKFPLLSVLIFVRVVLSGGTSAVLTVNPPRLRDFCVWLSRGCGVSAASAVYTKLALYPRRLSEGRVSNAVAGVAPKPFVNWP